MLTGQFRTHELWALSAFLLLILLFFIISNYDFYVHETLGTGSNDYFGPEHPPIDEGPEPPPLNIDPCSERPHFPSSKGNAPPPLEFEETEESQQEKCPKPVVFKTYKDPELGFQIEYGPDWHYRMGIAGTNNQGVTFESSNSSHSMLEILVDNMRGMGSPSCSYGSAPNTCTYFYSRQVSKYAEYILNLQPPLNRVVDYLTLIKNPMAVSKYLNVTLSEFNLDFMILKSIPISIPSTNGTMFAGLEVLIQYPQNDVEKNIFVRDRLHGYNLVIYPNDEQDSEIQSMIRSFALISPPTPTPTTSPLSNQISIKIPLPPDIRKDSIGVEIHELQGIVTATTFSNQKIERVFNIPPQADLEKSISQKYFESKNPNVDYIGGTVIISFYKKVPAETPPN